MKVCVLGATGGTGKILTKLLLDEGHDVTVYVRSPGKVELKHEKLTVTEGQLTDAEGLTACLTGMDAVMSCLGSSTVKKSTELADMANLIVGSMKKASVQRIVYMTTAGIEDEFRGVFKLFIRMILGNVIDDHRAAAQVYKNNGLDYTLIRPVQLSDDKMTGKYHEAEVGLPKSKKAVSRANVAHLMVKALHDERYIGKSIGITE